MANATITLYSKALNVGNNEYNVNANNGIAYLNSYKVYETTVENWRFNSETIRIAISQYFNLSSARTVVYIHIVTSEGDDTWHIVDNLTIQSGYVIYFCHMDLWGTYYKRALLTNLKLSRSNKKYGTIKGMFPPITQTYFDEIEFVENDMQEESGQPKSNVEDIYFSHLSVLFSLKYNIWEDPLFNKSSISEVQMFALPLSRLITVYETLIGDRNINIMDLIRETMGGIYAIDLGNNEYKAEVMGVWIVENDKATSGSTGYRLKFRTGITNFYDNEIAIDWINPYKANSPSYVRYITIEQDAQHEYYFGTYSLSMKLPRLVGDTVIAVKYIIENDKVSVIAQCGTEEKDITSAFGLTVSHLDGDVRNTTAMLNAMKSGLRFAGAGASAMIGTAKGGEYGAFNSALGLTNNIGDMAQVNTRMGGIIDSGDAYTTYWRSGYAVNGLLHNPFVLHKYESIIDEQDIVSHEGVLYNDYINDIDLTEEDPVIEYDPLCYIKLDEITVDRVPTNACEFIANQLRKGIYIINEQ